MKNGRNKGEILASILSASWHALRSYELGNSSPDLAKQTRQAIERTAVMLDVNLEAHRLAASPGNPGPRTRRKSAGRPGI